MTKTENRLGGVLGTLGSLRPRLGTRTVLEISILGLVVVLAIIFRVLRVRWGLTWMATTPCSSTG